ncbi:hypothetical protein B0T11DRAFT_291974 [Plectosphaerella cucumerina]|uniref:Uncharacterized protein n=1 Tax=Plectosphaerella cucumerina TaxID=40658 RepID=A0A8K0T6Z4_9PEZI|nr:hypothetical protein B0T11DRAFT_291974 [Plectosphaerella cucumerina]
MTLLVRDEGPKRRLVWVLLSSPGEGWCVFVVLGSGQERGVRQEGEVEAETVEEIPRGQLGVGCGGQEWEVSRSRCVTRHDSG